MVRTKKQWNFNFWEWNLRLFLNYFILCLLCNTDTKSKLLGLSQAGSTREALTKTEIEEFLVLQPKENILRNFHTNLSAIFNKMDSVNLLNNKLTEFKNVILSKLATIEN